MLEMLMGDDTPPPQIGTKMTYAQFQVWLADNTASYTTVANIFATMTATAGKYVNISLTPIGSNDNMYGSPYKEWFTNDSRLASIARHAHPSLSVLTNNTSDQPQVLMKFTPLSSWPTYVALDRNGYRSRPYGAYLGAQCLDFIYYDYTLGSVVRYNPFLDNDPVVFNGILV